MQQKLQKLRSTFASGPEAGAQAWEQIQSLGEPGYRPAQCLALATPAAPVHTPVANLLVCTRRILNRSFYKSSYLELCLQTFFRPLP